MPSLDDLARQSFVIKAHESRDTLTVSGPDRSTWLEGLVTCELKNLRPFSGTWGLVLNRQGKIQTDVWVLADENRLWLSLAASAAGAVGAELERMLIMEDAELEAPSEPSSWFTLHGPEAAARSGELARAHGGCAAPIDWLGLGGAGLVVPRREARAIRDATGGHELGEREWIRLRLERNLPEFGVDYDDRERPHEAALERRAVSWTKGCYLGQEVVCMQDMRGKVKRSLSVLAVAAPRDAELGGTGHVTGPGGQEVGSVTSWAWSDIAGAWLVMSRLERSAAAKELRYAEGAEIWPAHVYERDVERS